MSKFWETLGERLIDRWLEAPASALFFWLAAGLLWVLADGLGPLRDLTRHVAREPAVLQGIAAVSLMLAIAGSGLLVRSAARPLQRLIEGYWPSPFDRVSAPLIVRIRRQSEIWRGKQHQACTPRHG